jgi:peptidoglycan/LPS O-acetylase OafA/YrhL
VRGLEMMWCGVDLFFVLSGFLITGILLDTKGGPGYLRSFYGRRVVRILPVYYLTLAILTITVGVPHAPWFWGYAVNLLIARENSFAVAANGTSHLWTLAIEEQFYLVWPAIVMACRPRTLLRVCIGLATLAFLLRVRLVHSNGMTPVVTMYTFTLTRIDGLAFGAIVSVMLRHYRDALERWALPVFVLSGAIVLELVAVFHGFPSFSPIIAMIGYGALDLSFAGGIGLVALGSRGTKWLEARVLTSTGKYSYGLYVYHWPLCAAARRVFVASSLLQALGFATVVGALTVAVAVLSWHVWERPWLSLKRFMPYGLMPVGASKPQIEMAQAPYL